jgi:glutamine---fructose-6-phosphate transaminase (isomerizing)
MCGIVGYIGEKNAVPILLEGLKKLEYRGYDSAGIAFLLNGSLGIRRSVGKLRNLESAIAEEDCRSGIGIGHTRWATHGKPCEANAHPHRCGKVAVVHNGIIENYAQLRAELLQRGHTFNSETDTEVIAHLIDEGLLEGLDLESAVRRGLSRLKGAYAIGVVVEDRPDVLVAARAGCPLVIGLGAGEFFIASDLPPILGYTKEIIFLDDYEMAVLCRDGVKVTDLDGSARKKDISNVRWSPAMAEKNGYKHFMLKEIYEQPRAIRDTFLGRIDAPGGTVSFEDVAMDESLKTVKKAALIACGTSWHSCLIGKFMLEELARLPVEVDIASEFRYRSPIIGTDTLFVAVTQSGETADTLAAMREAKKLGARTISICNVVGSTASRDADGVIYTHAGPEIGVASTKAFTAQLTALFLLAVRLGRLRGTLDKDKAAALLGELTAIPEKVERTLSVMEDDMGKLAKIFYRSSDFLYLGRGYNYPTALEGALKLKEISYIHAEGYPAGEMKHGPIALIDENMPVVVLAPSDDVFEKVASNIEEVRSRGGQVIAFVTGGDRKLEGKANYLYRVPGTVPCLTPVSMAVPLQLLAYKVALLRGSDVDQPRNLAKSVTVE